MSVETAVETAADVSAETAVEADIAAGVEMLEEELMDAAVSLGAGVTTPQDESSTTIHNPVRQALLQTV